MVSRIIFTTTLLLTIIVDVNGQMQMSDIRDNGMGNSTVASFSEFGILKNIAVIRKNDGAMISGSFTNKYYIKELSPASVHFYKKIKNNISIISGMGRVGNASFSEQYFEAGLSKILDQKFSAGIKFQYYQWFVGESHYRGSHALIPEVFIYATPFSNVSFGANIRNPVRSRMSAIELKKLPAEINPGISCTISEKLNLSLSTTQRTEHPLYYQAGLEYKYNSVLIFRTGWNTELQTQAFGFGIKMKSILLDMALQFNNTLGNTSSISLTFLI